MPWLGSASCQQPTARPALCPCWKPAARAGRGQARRHNYPNLLSNTGWGGSTSAAPEAGSGFWHHTGGLSVESNPPPPLQQQLRLHQELLRSQIPAEAIAAAATCNQHLTAVLASGKGAQERRQVLFAWEQQGLFQNWTWITWAWKFHLPWSGLYSRIKQIRLCLSILHILQDLVQFNFCHVL